jgi:regulator of replication initiation timing
MSDLQEKKKKKSVLTILFVSIGLLSGVALYLGYTLKQELNDNKILERRSTSAEDRFKRLTGDVEKAKSLLNTIDISGIDSIALGEDVEAILAKRKESAEKIATLEGQIADLIKQSDGQASNFSQFKALYAKLKTEVYLLRSEISKLKAKNQALISENAKLKDENQQLGSDLAGANENNQKLEGINNDLEGKVALGKRLQTFEKIAEGVKVRRNGEEKSTNRARRADKIRVAFTIGKNEIADAGEINLFLRVLDPNDRVISENGEEFNYKSEKITFTSKKTVNYQKSSKDVIMFAEKTGGDSFQEGLYKVQVYTKSDMILVETFSLK